MGRRYTSISDADFVRQILSLRVPKAVRLSVFFARDYALQDLQANNVVLVGSLRSNPWAELFQDRLNFQFEVDPQTHVPHFRNRSPQAGEQPMYLLTQNGIDQDAYGVIAFLPNPSHTGNVLLISGTGINAIRAGGGFVTNEDLFRSLSAIRPQGKSQLPYFEVLYRTRPVGADARGCDPVAYRVYQR
jgi:hypothetical protein